MRLVEWLEFFAYIFVARRAIARFEPTAANQEELEKRLESVAGALASVSQTKKLPAQKKATGA